MLLQVALTFTFVFPKSFVLALKGICSPLPTPLRRAASRRGWARNRASAVQHAVVEKAAQAVLDARKKFPDATLADLYDPLAMPPALVKAHAKLDRAVDRSYRPQLFQNNHQRVEHLFALYEKLTAPLIPTPKKRRRKTHSN